MLDERRHIDKLTLYKLRVKFSNFFFPSSLYNACTRYNTIQCTITCLRQQQICIAKLPPINKFRRVFREKKKEESTENM